MEIRIASTDDEIRACYPTVFQLRAHLAEAEFVAQVRRQQREGYQLAYLADADATTYMRALFAGTAGYGVAHVARYVGHPPLLPARAIHASLASEVWIFERR